MELTIWEAFGMGVAVGVMFCSFVETALLCKQSVV